MKLKQIAITLSAAALSMSALTANATYFGDENDLSWMPGRDVIKRQPTFATPSTDTAPKQAVRFLDENDTSWLPTPAKR